MRKGLGGLGGSDYVGLNARVLHLPKGEAHVHLAPGIVLISSARQIDLEFVRAALLGHAPAALQAGAKLPKQRGMADVDDQRPHFPQEVPKFDIPPNCSFSGFGEIEPHG
jgi:hypothetical protein